MGSNFINQLCFYTIGRLSNPLRMKESAMSATATAALPMSLKERLFHSVLFEMGAVALGAGLVMALMAMVWNLLFNYGFDKLFTGPREQRGLGLRLLHTLSFEAGLLLMTIPMLAWLLQLSLWHAFLADVGLSALITVYALAYNWMYDHARALAEAAALARPGLMVGFIL